MKHTLITVEGKLLDDILNGKTKMLIMKWKPIDSIEAVLLCRKNVLISESMIEATFILRKIHTLCHYSFLKSPIYREHILNLTNLSYEEAMSQMTKAEGVSYGWFVSTLKVLHTPKRLLDYKKINPSRKIIYLFRMKPIKE